MSKNHMPVSEPAGEVNGAAVRRLLVRLRYSETLEIEGHAFSLRIEIPAGTISDGASVPRALWWLIPPYGLHERAAWIHDRLYCYNVYSRPFADAIFLGVMREDGVPFLRRWAMYLAVRLFGGPGYRAAGKRLSQSRLEKTHEDAN